MCKSCCVYFEKYSHAFLFIFGDIMHSNAKSEEFPLNPCAPDPEFTFPETAMVSFTRYSRECLHMRADTGLIPL